MKNNRSQTTVEFIIILAIVLVVAVLTLLMTNPLQIFTNNNRQSDIFWESGLIGMHALEIGTVNKIILENNLPQLVTIQNVTFTTTETYLIIQDQNIAKNKKETFSFTDPTSCTAGQTLIGKIKITYNTTDYIEEILRFEDQNYEVVCN